MTTGPTLHGHLRAAVLALCLPACAFAATPPPVDEATLKLDTSIQALKADVLDIHQRALDEEEKFLYPEVSRVNVYVGVKVSGLLLNDMTITVDDGEPALHSYDTIEAIVLQRRGLQRLVRINAAPGSHRIRGEFTAHYADARPEAPLVRGRYEAVFEKTLDPAELEFTIVQDGFAGSPTLKLRDWRATK